MNICVARKKLSLVVMLSAMLLGSSCSVIGGGNAVPPSEKRIFISTEERAYILPSDCPNWSDNMTTNYNNWKMANLGCANISNLGAMVANPEDLLVGRGAHHAQTDSAVRAVERFYNGELTPTVVSGERFSSGDR